MVIAIDGPAGSGKSTVSKAVAERLGATYLDSGAMYRVVALKALAGADPVEAAAGTQITLGSAVTADGVDVTSAIRTPDVSAKASEVAAHPAVREALVAKQRELLAGSGDWVAEGRDIGTVVAPGAELKVFLTASPEERAKRRAIELGISHEQVLADQNERDLRDTTREASPLMAADGAVEVDTTGLTIDGVVDRIATLAKELRR